MKRSLLAYRTKFKKRKRVARRIPGTLPRRALLHFNKPRLRLPRLRNTVLSLINQSYR